LPPVKPLELLQYLKAAPDRCRICQLLLLPCTIDGCFSSAKNNAPTVRIFRRACKPDRKVNNPKSIRKYRFDLLRKMFYESLRRPGFRYGMLFA